MVDVAKLGISIDTSDVDKAVVSVNKIVPAAEAAEKATEKLKETAKEAGSALSGMSNESDKVARGLGGTTAGVNEINNALDRTRIRSGIVRGIDNELMNSSATAKVAAGEFDAIGKSISGIETGIAAGVGISAVSNGIKEIEATAPKAANGIKQLANDASTANSLLGGLTKIAKELTPIFTIVGTISFLKDAIDQARDLSVAIADLHTLLPGVNVDFEQLVKTSEAFGLKFGTSQAEQVRGFYQAVSGGASDAASATKILDEADKLAIAGITTLGKSIDILTTATNAYRDSNLSASEASDSIFKAVSIGKVRVEELASRLGNVIPLAHALGVSFDELTGTVAALSLQGINAARGVFDLKAILENVEKPTAVARKEAAALGIEFNGVALRSKGFQAFMQDIIDKAHGSKEAITNLFGSVTAANAVFALAGDHGAVFNKTLDQIKTKAGAADEAYGIVADSLEYRTKRLTAEISNASSVIGTQLLTVGLNFGDYVSNALRGALSGVRSAGVQILAVNEGVIDAIVSLFKSLPEAIADIFKGIVNVVTGYMNDLVNAVIASINLLTTAVNNIPGVNIDKILPVDFSTNLDTGFASAGQRAADAFTKGYEHTINQLDPRIFDSPETRAKPIIEVLAKPPVDPLAASLDAQAIGLRTDKIKKEVNDTKFVINETAKAMQGFANDIVTGFRNGEKAAQIFTTAVGNLLSKIGTKLIDAGINALFGGFDPLQSLTNSLTGTNIGEKLVPTLRNSAHGSAWAGGNEIHMFASGGVVDSPTGFGFNGGAGLMGEAGPEAIVPLSRGSDGKLGIRSNGSQSVGYIQNVNVTVSVDDEGKIKAFVTKSSARAATEGANAAIRNVHQNFPSLLLDAQQRTL